MSNAKPSPEILAFMEKHSIDSDEIWQVHGASWVIKHKALERAAVAAGIVWDRPAMVEHDAANKIAVICVFGKLGEQSEWSIGEASPANNKNAYPYAMAEKRGKDRVILKLLNAHGALYSEAEADEFAESTQPGRRQNPHVTRPADIMPATRYDEDGHPIDNIPAPDADAIKKLTVKDQRPIFEALQKEIHATASVAALTKWAHENRNRLGELKPDWQEFLRGVYAEHLTELRKQDRGDDMRMAG